MSPPKKVCQRNLNATAEDWREVTEKMTTDEKNQYMLEHGILTDCTFVVGPEEGETKEFQVHRFLLCNASAVFERMLTGEMVEAKTGRVRVTDLSPNTLQLLLSSIYGKDPKMTTFQEAQEFAYAAHKYQIKLLLEHGVTRMRALILPENIWAAFDTADLLQNERLKNMSIQILKSNTLQFITDPGFLQASEENVALLLEQDELNVDDEASLVNITVHWARHAAHQRGLSEDDSGVRAVLEPRLLKLFRFLAMSPQQFTFGPGLASWLTVDEKAAISKCLRSIDLGEKFDKLLPHLCAVTEKRKIFKNSSNVLTCNREIIGSSSNTCQPEENNFCGKWVHMRNKKYSCYHATLIFNVKTSCQWLGFQHTNQCTADPSLPPAENQVYRERIVSKMYTFKPDASQLSRILVGEMSWDRDVKFNSSVSFMFDKPIRLVARKWFALEVRICYSSSPVRTFLRVKRARSVCTEAGVEFVFLTDEQQLGFNSKNEGLIDALIFSLTPM